jgi:hypothetical protein
MAGRGFAPKDPSKRAGHGKDPNPTTTIRFVGAEQPALPVEMDWHPRTLAWWAMWGRSPQADHFMESDWDFLMDTALMHHAMWEKGQWTLAAEVRLRVAKYGATPEDRARLRMHFADADEKDDKRTAKTGAAALERYGVLKALPSSSSE